MEKYESTEINYFFTDEEFLEKLGIGGNCRLTFAMQTRHDKVQVRVRTKS